MLINIFWFRRDLRLSDNAGLYHALRADIPVLGLFIFDAQILDALQDKSDARVSFIYDTVSELKWELEALGSSLLVRYGKSAEVWADLLKEYRINSVFLNHDYEPAARERDNNIKLFLKTHHIDFQSFKDQVIFEKNEVVKEDGKPYTVFTPYSKKWKACLEKRLSITDTGDTISFYLKSYPTERYFHRLLRTPPLQNLELQSIGFTKNNLNIPAKTVTRGLIRNYHQTRDFPALQGTSKLGIHFRFGTISIRQKAAMALKINEIYLNELIWRDFFSMILYHFPYVATEPFRAEYNQMIWRNDIQMFEKWCQGKTGYPLVDAGMRELNQTGYMHNRVRMVAASFLSKHLLIDWRWGEAYFAQKLLDFELASNNGGWQWAAGCGTDAAPYFRIFNPMSQQLKFDKDLHYIRHWIPEYATPAYPKPIVEHTTARAECLKCYQSALKKQI